MPTHPAPATDQRTATVKVGHYRLTVRASDGCIMRAHDVGFWSAWPRYVREGLVKSFNRGPSTYGHTDLYVTQAVRIPGEVTR